MIKCPKCGKEYPDTSKFCGVCGIPIGASQPAQPQQPTQQQPKNEQIPPMQQNRQPVPPESVQSQQQPQPQVPPMQPQNAPPTQNAPQQNVVPPHSSYAPPNAPPNAQGQMPPQYEQNRQYSYGPGSYPPNNAYSQYPDNSAPMTTGQFFLTTFLLSLPIVGIILAIVWAVGGSDTNINRRNYSRSMLIWYAVSVGVSLIFLLISIITMGAVVGGISDAVLSSYMYY